MNDLQFISTNRKRYAEFCPCGRDNKDGKYAPVKGIANTGYCHSCGQFFKDKNEAPIKLNPVAEKIKLPQKFIFNDIIKRMTDPDKYYYNNFASWLITNFQDKALQALQYFNVGTGDQDETIFFMQDKMNRFVNGRLFEYDRYTGKRLKAIPPLSMFRQKDGYYQCFFGEFQLNKYSTIEVINLVESEKTAIIGYILYPGKLWLSYCGATACTKQKSMVLKGRKVRVWSDLDQPGRVGAVKATKNLKLAGATAEIIDINKAITDGTDLADILIQNKR